MGGSLEQAVARAQGVDDPGEEGLTGQLARLFLALLPMTAANPML